MRPAPPVLELHQLAVPGAGQPVRPYDTVRHADDAAHVGHLGPHAEGAEPVLDLSDQIFCFHVPPSSSMISLM